MFSIRQFFRDSRAVRIQSISLLLLMTCSSVYALPNSDIALRLNRAFRPYCEMKPDIGAEVRMTQDRDTFVAQILNVAQEGPSYKAGLRDGDTLVSIDGVATAGLTQKKFLNEVWSPAAEQAVLKKIPLIVRKVASRGAEPEQEVRVNVERNCGFPSSDVYQESIVFAQAMLPEQSDNAIAFEMARAMAFAHFDRQSTGKNLHILGLILGGVSQRDSMDINAATTRVANQDWRLQAWAPRASRYTDNDYLSADYLAMVAMRVAGFSIDDYLDDVAISNSAKPGNFERIRNFGGKPSVYDEGALEKLRKIHAHVLAGDFKRGANLVDFKPSSSDSGKPRWLDTHDGPIPKSSNFASLLDAEAIPRITVKGKEHFLEWLEKPFPKAVAISEKGAFAGGYGKNAMDTAITSCEKLGSPCRLYAVDDMVVFVPFPPEQHEKQIPEASNFARLEEVSAIPHLSVNGKDLYQQWLKQPFPRAVAVSGRGALARAYGAEAMTAAVTKCEKFGAPCHLYAVDDRVVFIPFTTESVK